jgi:hypothetical protein
MQLLDNSPTEYLQVKDEIIFVLDHKKTANWQKKKPKPPMGSRSNSTTKIKAQICRHPHNKTKNSKPSPGI